MALLRTGAGYPCARTDGPSSDDYRADVVAQARLLPSAESWVGSGPRWRNPKAGWLGSLAGLATATGGRVAAVDYQAAWVVDDAWGGQYPRVPPGTPVAREYAREELNGTTLWIDTRRVLIAGVCDEDPSPGPTPRSGTPSPSGRPTGLPSPGAPYSAEEIARLIEEADEYSGPHHFPRDIAARLAERLVTFDGQRYASVSHEGIHCGANTCEVALHGQNAAASPEYESTDWPTFRVDLIAGTVTYLEQWQPYDRGALPAAFHAEIDRRIRALDPSGLPADARYFRALWLPPPDHGQFIGDYGGECRGWNVLYDWNTDRVVSVTQTPGDPEYCS